MARKNVVQITCDRCKKTEFQTPKEGENGEAKPPEFEASFSGKKLVYADLCEKCREAVENLWQDLKEWERERKYTIFRHGSNGEEAPPLTTAPNYTPQQPHSAAAAKR